MIAVGIRAVPGSSTRAPHARVPTLTSQPDDQTDRPYGLGDASVPFPFDVHAMFFADDAVTVEADLHRVFADRRVNLINQRREFFFATPAEVRTVLLEQVGNLLEFAEEPEATQYLQSMKYWRAHTATASGPGT